MIPDSERQSAGMRRRSNPYLHLMLLGLAGTFLVTAVPAGAQELVFPDKPPSEHWFVDEADLIGMEERTQIDEIALSLWQEEEIPVYIVTIRSIAGYIPITGFCMAKTINILILLSGFFVSVHPNLQRQDSVSVLPRNTALI